MRIGELAEATGTTPKTLRFYEETGLLHPPERTSSGYRDYPHDTVARLHFIRRSRSAGLTLAQIRDILNLRDAGKAPCQHVKQLLAARLAELNRQITDLQLLRATVAELRTAAIVVEPASCDPTNVCRYL